MAGQDPDAGREPAYHLLLDAQEIPLAAHALRLLISDEAHQAKIRALAREVLAELDVATERVAEHPQRAQAVALSAEQMKITHSALRLLLNDLRRDQPEERRLLQEILAKLPDEHAIRAIVIE